MDGPRSQHDPATLRALEAARLEHVTALAAIPLQDRVAFAVACERYEAKIEAILQAAAQDDALPPDESGAQE